MSGQVIISLLLGVFIVYRIFLRVRRTFGWQQLNLGKVRIMTVILGVVGLLFFVEGAFDTVSLISNMIGIALGIALACCGAAKTRFERRDGNWRYRPSAWIGGTVTILFLGRLIYRIYDMMQSGNLEQGLQLSDRLKDMGSSWTSGLMLIMFAYYVTCNIILLSRQELRVSGV
ncbi:hypothetical protein K0U00_06230 [Paenibacillus sepulcri]|uniref:DUF1453 domain-containing protein n=1 Tax=Paenibacillus sepulcri TaxID=359917 RepID=A0ABS7BYH0_9BACL|nr:hypothetical protein [Paenibacillus sepulcri]